MTKQEALEVIKQENLVGANLEGKSIQPNQVGIITESSIWKVFSTDEKADLRIIKKYELENLAIENVIECLRINKKISERFKRRSIDK